MTEPARTDTLRNAQALPDMHAKTANSIDLLAFISACLFGWLTVTAFNWYRDFVQRTLLEPIADGAPQGMFNLVVAIVGSSDHLFFASFCIGSTFGLIASIGLFKRAAWARIAFMAILLTVMLVLLGCLVGFFIFVMGDPYFCRGSIAECRQTQGTLFTILLLAFSVITAVICRFLSKAILMLHSTAVRQTFQKRTTGHQST